MRNSLLPPPPAPPVARRSLRRVMWFAKLKVALVAVSLAGLAMSVVGFVALRAYAAHNLQLVARSVGYTVEAALVFRDPAAAAEAISLIASPEDVAEIAVSDAQGQPFALWRRPDEGRFQGLEDHVGRLVFPEPVVLPLVRGPDTIGSVRLVGHGGALLHFLLMGLAGLLVCLFLSALAAAYSSRRVVRHITRPLTNLAVVAHAVRRERAFAQRVPASEIRELNTLGEDFNGLLDEFEGWQRTLQDENSTLAHRASHDSLTGLRNRAFFESRFNRAVREAEETGERLALLFVDADRFKDINDSWGHAAGDAVLVCLASRLRAQVRETDLVGRLGGDEFAILITPLHDAADARHIAENLAACMREPMPLPEGSTLQTSVSVGVAIYPEDGRSTQALMMCADAAMYTAKSRRRADGRRAADPSPHSDIDIQERPRAHV